MYQTWSCPFNFILLLCQNPDLLRNVQGDDIAMQDSHAFTPDLLRNVQEDDIAMQDRHAFTPNH